MKYMSGLYELYIMITKVLLKNFSKDLTFSQFMKESSKNYPLKGSKLIMECRYS